MCYYELLTVRIMNNPAKSRFFETLTMVMVQLLQLNNLIVEFQSANAKTALLSEFNKVITFILISPGLCVPYTAWAICVESETSRISVTSNRCVTNETNC